MVLKGTFELCSFIMQHMGTRLWEWKAHSLQPSGILLQFIQVTIMEVWEWQSRMC